MEDAPEIYKLQMTKKRWVTSRSIKEMKKEDIRKP